MEYNSNILELGSFYSYKGECEDYAPSEVVKIVGIGKIDMTPLGGEEDSQDLAFQLPSHKIVYLITHPEGGYFDDLENSAEWDSLAENIEAYEPLITAESIELLELTNELSIESEPFKALTLEDRLQIAISLGDKAYIGDRIMVGELALVARADYEVLQKEYIAILKLAHALNHSITPIFNHEGRELLLSFFKNGKPKLAKLLADFTIPGRSKLVGLLKKFNVEPLKQLPSGFLLELSRKHGLNFNEIELLINDLTPKVED
ncbi:MAG: hypothetical protein MK212_15795 [Saprospiraceae bacterium]|nr:hypothetical protein [Saprospiraceae bacterium]